MSILSIMFGMWGVAVGGFTILMIYRSYLTQHETDQLFLAEEAVDFNHAEHDDIVRRVDRLCPLCKWFGIASIVMTAAITGVYVAQALPYVKF